MTVRERDRRDRLGWRSGLVLASTITAVLLAGAAAVRDPLGPAGPALDQLLPVLSGTALLLFGLLAAPRLPTLAWAAVSLAAAAGALEIMAVVRSLEPVAAGPGWLELSLLAGLAIVGATVVGAGFATRRLRRASPIGLLAVLAVGIGVMSTTGAAAWAVLAAGQPDITASEGESVTPIRLAARLGLATMAGAFIVGVARAVGPAAMRAAERARSDGGRQPGTALWRYLALLADELVPSRSDARRSAAEQERARLAADLHAHVLPELRRAAAAAQSAGLPSDVQVDLRRALEDVEQLMHQRQSVVLEQFGLVAALEWLAERTEERSALRVHLDLGDAVPDSPAAIEPVVGRAAFRIALLGLDNVVRHAGATTATLRLAGDATRLSLVIEDDGAASGFDGSGGRGIADMRTAAAESGGSIAFATGTGARITATWPVERGATDRSSTDRGSTDPGPSGAA